MADERGGDVLLASSATGSACALLRVIRSSGMLRDAAVSVMVLIVRLWLLILRELVVRDGMTGAPTLGDCGSLLDPFRFKPGSGMAGFEGLAGGVPVKAARLCARAASASTISSLSLEVLLVCT